MQYVAMEWDHSHSSEQIRWVVMECAGLVEEENGAIQALKPRRDIAYFLSPRSAEEDALRFAEAKNSGATATGSPSESKLRKGGYRAYPWDHCAGSDLISWAVLRADPSLRLGREDIAYFVAKDSSEGDAQLFEALMNRLDTPEDARRPA